MGSKQSCESPTWPGQTEAFLSPHSDIHLPQLGVPKPTPQLSKSRAFQQDYVQGIFKEALGLKTIKLRFLTTKKERPRKKGQKRDVQVTDNRNNHVSRKEF